MLCWMDVLSEAVGIRSKESLFLRARDRMCARGVMYDADYDDAAAAAAAAPPSEAPLPYRVCLCSGEEEWSVISLSRVQDLPR